MLTTTPHGRSTRRIAPIALVLFLWPATAFAQSGQTAQIPLQFDFLNPGARSLGLGSAFTAVADDATAAFTNPAGLRQLVRKEFSAELRIRSLDTPFLSGGRLSGPVSKIGIDTVAGPTYGTTSDQAVRLYFLSFVYPKGRWSIAGYRHELVRQSNTFLGQGAFQQAIVSGNVFSNIRLLGLTGSRDISIDNYGGAASYRASSRVSIGAGVSIYHFSNTSSFASLGFVGDTFSAADPSTAGKSSTTTQSGSATKAAVNVGALVTVNPKLLAGAVFRQGVSFGFTQVSTVPGQPTINESGQFRTPHVFGFGVRILPDEAFSIAIDYDRVMYSRLDVDFIQFQVDPASASRVTVPDGNEVHVGVEYTLTKVKNKPSLRGGIWFDPDHSVQYASDFSDSATDQRLRATFPPGVGVWHYCFGFGMPLPHDNFEFNVGADLASARRYVSASIVARFGK